MKPVLIHGPKHGRGAETDDNNELLRLAMEMADLDGRMPEVDIAGAAIGHWNGQRISVDPTDIAELIDRQMLDGGGRWTDFGRALVSFAAAQYEDAGDYAARACGGPGPQEMVLALLAAARFKLGWSDEANEAVTALMTRIPGISCARFRVSPLAARDVMESLAEALAGAGLPDEEAAPPRVGPGWNR